MIFLKWFLIYIPSLFRSGLHNDADSVHAEASREKVLSGDWVTLHVDYIRYLEKAPKVFEDDE